MSWVWKIGCCFCGCSDNDEPEENLKCKLNYEIVDKEPMKRMKVEKILPRRKKSVTSIMDSSSMSCSGYQTFACTSDSGSQSDDEGSVDLKPVKKRLADLIEEDPSDKMDEECETEAEVTLTLKYDEVNCRLTVSVVNCQNLPCINNKKNTSNPYVQVSLLPDASKKNKRKTRTCYETVNPHYEEVLPWFDLAMEDVEKHHLRVCVWHSSSVSSSSPDPNLLKRVQMRFLDNNQKICLGETFISLTRYLLRRPQTRTYPLSAPKINPFLSMNVHQLNTSLGRINIWLKFTPKTESDSSLNTNLGKRRGSKGDLTRVNLRNTITPRVLGSLEIKIVGAEELPTRESGKPPKPYCKVFLFGNQQNRLGLSNGLKQTTPIANSNCNPQWNHHIAYHNLTLNILSDCCLEISIWDDFKRKSNEFIGGIRLSLLNSPALDNLDNQQTMSMSLDTRKDHVFDSLEAERKLWSDLLDGVRGKIIVGKIPLRNFTPYDKIRCNFGGISEAHYNSDTNLNVNRKEND